MRYVNLVIMMMVVAMMTCFHGDSGHETGVVVVVSVMNMVNVYVGMVDWVECVRQSLSSSAPTPPTLCRGGYSTN